MTLQTLIIIPITSTIRLYPWRVQCVVSGKEGSIASDQIKVVDRSRIKNKIGELSKAEVILLKNVLSKMLIE